jgi:hypothetical protein
MLISVSLPEAGLDRVGRMGYLYCAAAENSQRTRGPRVRGCGYRFRCTLLRMPPIMIGAAISFP